MESSVGSKSNEYRYERKYRIPIHEQTTIDRFLRLGVGQFREIYNTRFVNNVYYDSLGVNSYIENLAGVANRLKTRIRWYGGLAPIIERPCLEKKIKKGFVGTKKSIYLEPIALANDLSSKAISKKMKNAGAPAALCEDFRQLRPILINRYERQYFLSRDSRFRATVDKNVEYYTIPSVLAGRGPRWIDRDALILELKYAVEDDEDAITITNYLEPRVSRNSKYLNGFERLSL